MVGMNNLRNELLNRYARQRAEAIEREGREMAAAKLYGWTLAVIDHCDDPGGMLRFDLVRVPPGVSLPHGKRLTVLEMTAQIAAAFAH